MESVEAAAGCLPPGRRCDATSCHFELIAPHYFCFPNRAAAQICANLPVLLQVANQVVQALLTQKVGSCRTQKKEPKRFELAGLKLMVETQKPP